MPDEVNLAANTNTTDFDEPALYTGGFDAAGVQLPTTETPYTGLRLRIGTPRQFLNTVDTVIKLGINQYRSVQASTLIEFTHKGETRQGFIVDLSYEVGKGTAEVTLLEKSLVL